jgi:GAF domain-containing protein
MKPENRDRAIPSHIVGIWQAVVDSIADFLSVPSVMINRLEPPELEVFRSNTGSRNPFPSGTRMQMAGIYCAEAAEKQQRLEIHDARKDPRGTESPTAKAGIFAYLGFPIFWPDGEVFGTLCAVDTQENKWEKKAIALLKTFKDAIEAHLALVVSLEHLERKKEELEYALGEVRTLRGLLTMCASCKKVYNDQGSWEQIEAYITKHSGVEFSHGICPDCAKRLYPELEADELT